MRRHFIPCFLAICALQSAALLAQEPKRDSTDKAKAWFAFYHREANEAYRFTLDPGNRELELDPTPILRWTNPLEEGDIHGVVYVWRLEGRPVVVGQLFSYLNGKGGRVYCHAMHSLARKDETLAGLRENKPFWTPASPGVEMRDVPDARAPSASRAARLAQMKAIAQRFSAYTEEATRGKRILRLLPTPLDRYRESAADDADGALFSFVVGNDPEVILLVEKGDKAAGGATWQYGLVRSTRSTSVALLDEREVWRYDSEGQNPADPRSGYLSVHGIATLPLEPPDRPAANPKPKAR
jgi:hypothetical protein